MSFDPVYLEGLIFLVYSIPSGFTFFPPLPWGFLIPEGRDLMEILHLGLNVLRGKVFYNLTVAKNST